MATYLRRDYDLTHIEVLVINAFLKVWKDHFVALLVTNKKLETLAKVVLEVDQIIQDHTVLLKVSLAVETGGVSAGFILFT